MKKLTYHNPTLIAIIALLLLSIQFSCTKNKEYSGEENAKLIINVVGIKNYETDLGKKAQTFISTKDISLANEETKLTSKVFMNTSATESEIQPNSPGQKLRQGHNKAKMSATETMKEGITYRIILYYKDNSQFAKSFQCVAGEPFEIAVQEGREYIWYAYSYNNTDNITQPNTSNPVITTPTDKDLLWATSGTAGVTATATGVNLPITFSHRLAQIHVKINTELLYGQLTDLEAEFSDNYVETSNFSILSGTPIGATTPIAVGPLNFSPHPDSTNIVEAKYYTVNPSLINSYKVTINKLSVEYVNGSTEDLIIPSAPREATFQTFTPQIGKSHVGNLKLSYQIAQKFVLHASIANIYGYGAEPRVSPLPHAASHNMIRDERNFGNEAFSKIKIADNNTHIAILGSAGQGTATMKPYINPANNNKPDIIIIGYYYYFNTTNTEEKDWLVQYVNNGGVLILMTDDVTMGNSHEPFLRDLYGINDINITTTGNTGGAIYLLSNTNDMILNGPFGDIRALYWGEDTSTTTQIENLPNTSVISYSHGVKLGGSTSGLTTAHTMFRDRNRNFIWIGDAGFLANSLASGTEASFTAVPFATNANNYPINKSYGLNTAPFPRQNVSNSILFANIMAWAYMRAEFFGINTGGL